MAANIRKSGRWPSSPRPRLAAAVVDAEGSGLWEPPQQAAGPPSAALDKAGPGALCWRLVNMNLPRREHPSRGSPLAAVGLSPGPATNRENADINPPLVPVGSTLMT